MRDTVTLTRDGDKLTAAVAEKDFSVTLTLDGCTRPWADEVIPAGEIDTIIGGTLRDCELRIESPLSGDVLVIWKRMKKPLGDPSPRG